MSAAIDYAAGGEYGYTGEVPDYSTMPGDVRDTAQMQPFLPQAAQQQGMSWWEAVAAYGITRAIDNRFAAPNTMGNVYPGSIAGQNGYTYQQGRTGTGLTMNAGQAGGFSLSPTMLLLIVGGLLAYRAMAD